MVVEDGILIDGLYLEGARWDSTSNKIDDLNANSIAANNNQSDWKMPLMIAKAAKTSKTLATTQSYYNCPVYRSAFRGDNNMVATIKLPSDASEKHWVKRGAILITHYDNEAMNNNTSISINPYNL